MSINLATISPGIGAASYWEPNKLMTSAWHEHAPFAAWLVSVTRPRTIVELGTHNGYSFFVFAEAVRRLQLTTKLFAVDTWEGDDQAGFYSEDVYQSVADIANRDYADSTTLIRAYFSDAANRFDEGSIDILHIDGRHGYEDVAEDFETYRSKLSSRAVVLFHDTFEFQDGFGVHQLWKELSSSFPSFEFHHGHGLGVLALGDEVQSQIIDFVARGKEDPDPLRMFYAERGALITQRVADNERRIQLETEAQARKMELNEMHAKALDAVHELELVRGSTSWRVTAPMRALTGALFRPHG